MRVLNGHVDRGEGNPSVKDEIIGVRCGGNGDGTVTGAAERTGADVGRTSEIDHPVSLITIGGSNIQTVSKARFLKYVGATDPATMQLIGRKLILALGLEEFV